MKRRFNLSQTKALLDAAIRKQLVYIEACKGDSNPQVVEMRNKAQGKLEAYQAMADALCGDMVMLRISAG